MLLVLDNEQLIIIRILFYFFDEVRRMPLTKHQADAQITKKRKYPLQKRKELEFDLKTKEAICPAQ